MDQMKPSKPVKAKRAKKVQPPLSAEDKKLFEEDKEKSEMTMKYAPRMKVGSPNIKAPGSKKVTTVGLGNLTVETIDGNTYV